MAWEFEAWGLGHHLVGWVTESIVLLQVLQVGLLELSATECTDLLGLVYSKEGIEAEI